MTRSLYLPRPRTAVGTYLRIVSINDVYDINNYPYVETLIQYLKQTAEDAVVISTMSGDFLSPCLTTSLDGGKAMLDVLKVVTLDYISLGNHEFDVTMDVLRERFKTYEGKCLNSNISNLPVVNASGQPLPKYDIVEVGSHKVAFGGFCLNKPSIFRPGTNITIQPIFDALKETWSNCPDDVTMLVPLTHQTIAEDRELATQIKQDELLRGNVPVILGGHEHEIYLETVEQSLIVKAGMDGVNAVVIDVWWDASEQRQTAVHLLSSQNFEANPKTQEFVDNTHKLLGALMGVEIFQVKEAMSSKRTRFQPEKVPSTLCSYIKKGLKNIDLVMLQGGCVRGKQDYEKGASFTYADLLQELPFGTEIATIQIPGYVLQESISQTRSTPDRETSNFLHADFDVVIEDYPSLKIVSINRAPFDPQKIYTLGIVQVLLTGLDEIKPLVDYVKANGGAPSLEQCLPGKNLIVESCMKDAWRLLIDSKEWDANDDGQMSKEELEQGVKNAFAFLDRNQDGHISPAELEAALTEKTGSTHKGLIDLMFTTLDTDADGKVSMDELASLAM